MNGKKEEVSDRISDMFHGRTVLVTGGSGFLGKVLIEKLLRSCEGVKTIYLLLRSKKGKTPEERMEDIFNNAVFEVLKKQQPKTLTKCKPLAGDITEIGLGISQEDREKLRDEVEFIYHSAASTRFDDTVKTAAKMNTRGTKFMLDLAHECKKLKAFIHVSTAYAFPKQKILYEKIYAPPADPHKILASIDFNKNDDSEEHLHLKLLGNCPNTYTFTKALAEGLVAEEMNNLPVIIVRPSVVCPTVKEPFPGWCNNLQGPMGLFVGAGKGILRSMYVNSQSYADFIPADIAIKAIITATWTFVENDRSQRVFNITSSADNSYTWEEIIELGKDVIYNEVPFNGIVWYPGGTLKKSKLVHNICFYLFQIIPALLIDALLMVLGYPAILYNIQRRIQKGSEMFEYYTTKAWNFSNEAILQGESNLNSVERKKFHLLGGVELDLRTYFKDCVLSLRRNNLKETDDMLPAAKRNMKIMWVLDKFCKALFVFAVLYYGFSWVYGFVLNA